MESSEAALAGIPVVFQEYEQAAGEKGVFGAVGRWITRVEPLDTEGLSTNLTQLCAQLGSVFDGVTSSVQDYEVSSFEVTVEVSGKGEVRLVGGASVELKGGLKLTFTRQPSAGRP